MNIVSRTITGVVAICLGLFLIGLALWESLWILLYGMPVFVIGFFVLFNEKEDEVEKIKDNKDNK